MSRPGGDDAQYALYRLFDQAFNTAGDEAGRKRASADYLTVRDALTFDPERPDCNDRCHGEPCVHQTAPLQRPRNASQGEGGAVTPPGLDKPSMKYEPEVE